MRILIRAEGGNRIGMGHVMRMLVLAGKLREFAEVFFVCRDNEEFRAGAEHIEACGYQVLRIDGEKLAGELEGIGGDCLITDSYDVDESYFDSMKGIFRVTGYMDDLYKHRINTDFIINQNIYANDLGYKAGKSTTLFLGTRYVLLRDEFRSIPERTIGNKIENVLITFGGADPGNLTEGIAIKLGKAFPDMHFHIVVGPSFIHKESLRKIDGGNIILHHNPKMSELMLKCDIAIAACGSTVYELCACGTPIIGIAAADNQIMVAQKMSSIRALSHAEGADEVIRHLVSMDYETRERMSKKGRKLVDGYGSDRLAEEIRKIIIGKV